MFVQYVAEVGLNISNMTLSNSSVVEGVSGETVGTLSVGNGGKSPFTYEITSNPNSLFQIANTNELQTATVIDYDTYQSSTITIRVTDSIGRQFSKEFTITIEQAPYTNAKKATFNGADEYITDGTKYRFARTDPFSVSLWAKLDATANSRVFCGNQLNSGGYPGWAVYNLSGALAFDFYQGLSAYLSVESSTSVFNTSNTYHIVMTYSGSGNAAGVTLYVDNVAKTKTTNSNTLSGTITYAANFQISGIDGANYLFDGTMDELTIFNKELSAQEVSDLYNSGTPGDITQHSAFANCVGWYRMGENVGSGTMVEEITSSNATLVNMDAANFVSY